MPLFAPLFEAHLRRVARLFAVGHYRDGSVLVHEGDPGDSFFVLLGGKGRIEQTGARTQELGPGQWFGELSPIDGAPRAATVTAYEETTVTRLPRNAFQSLLKDEPRTALGMVAGLVALIRGLQQE